MLLNFLRQWTLPLAIVVGIAGYFLYTSIPALDYTHTAVLRAVGVVQPVLIFLMLFITFCKVRPREIHLARWHVYALIMQIAFFTLLMVALLLLRNARGWQPSQMMPLSVESAMLCFICPTATAAAVVTAKLGGNAGTLTTYTVLINLVVALVVPAAVPLLYPDGSATFLHSFLLIIIKVFPLLMGPLLLAMLLRWLVPRFVRAVASVAGLAFYLWAVSLTLAIAVSVKALVHSHASLAVLIGIAAASTLACAVQFAFGRVLGRRFNDTVSATQSCGQKNTVFAIWLGYTFLDPLTALAGGFYSIWHNLYNSWQLRRRAMNR